MEICEYDSIDFPQDSISFFTENIFGTYLEYYLKALVFLLTFRKKYLNSYAEYKL